MRRFSNLFASLLLSMGFLLSSCGDDDDDNDSPIVGEWRSSVFSIRDCEDGSGDILDFSCGGCFTNDYGNDGSFSSRVLIPGSLDSTQVGTYTITGNMITTCDENGENCETSTFTIDDDELLLMGEGLGCTLEVNFDRS